MHDRPPKAGLSGRRCDLDRATRVAGRHQIRLQSRNVANLADGQVAGGFGLNEIVDAGAATTHFRFDRADELEAWNRSKELARLGPYALGVGEMTRIVVGDLGLQGLTRGSRLTEFRQHL